MELVAEEGTRADRAEMLAQVVRGIAAGVGFLGAGAILKRAETEHIRGLTTAAGIWMTAAAGVAVGAGWIGPAVTAVVLSWAVLHLAAQLPIRKHPDKSP
jgi:putative Mg2+ transporter-C (MgtC) family protein